MLAEHSVDPFWPDGIHADVWGQFLLVRLLRRGAGIELADVEPLADLLAANWQAVAYGSASFGPETTRAWVRRVLLGE